ncbi:Pre-mrna-splicing factor cwc26 [Thalictrum thalictroides]|uniref:Pre-mrna-splicing factor cwc26 n=1 Tax=Thalictrum thalictroides TaxID=46969 RepID=A0A7J6WKR7_THATH|nr:Pre-mrna-splicing factor cwc26 [Thalictrum thalictroides]
MIKEEEKPQVEEEIEVKRMKRMEKIRARNHGVSEDGSGWVVVHSKKPDDLGADLSPPRRNRPHSSELSPPQKGSARRRERLPEMLKSKKGKEKPKEIKLEWGKGLVQKREAEAKEHVLELEKERPFARTSDDPELDKMLKEQVRWGDPMAYLVKRKQYWIIKRIEATSNRYGIRPGRHWDGVDRSNGIENEYFKRKNEKQATEREAYLWSVSDM